MYSDAEYEHNKFAIQADVLRGLFRSHLEASHGTCCSSYPSRFVAGGFLGLRKRVVDRTEWSSVRSEHLLATGSGSLHSRRGRNRGRPRQRSQFWLSDVYVCRAQIQGSLVPGKWVQGSCNVAFGNAEQIMARYEVAYGAARWGKYRGDTYGLIQTGNEPDGSPLFSCRVHYVAGMMNTDYGYQPGKLVADGHLPLPVGRSGNRTGFSVSGVVWRGRRAPIVSVSAIAVSVPAAAAATTVARL